MYGLSIFSEIDKNFNHIIAMISVIRSPHSFHPTTWCRHAEIPCQDIVCQARVNARIMHELPWITILWSRVRWFTDDFHEWRSHEWKSLANHLTRDQNIVIHGNEYIILFLTRCFMSWTHSSAKNDRRSFSSPLSPTWPRKVFSALALWRHHRWSVTSGEREVLALWRYIRQLFLHAQIGAKAIFTSE